ncbi:MAG: hypothetical protein MI717_02755 [Spirochaetales bacterium]|nr:hypothetical protein [Spirochaetales bacterium]
MTKNEDIDEKRRTWLEAFIQRHDFSNQDVATLFFGTHHAISQYRRGVRRTSKRLIACAMVWEQDPELWRSIRDEVQSEFGRRQGEEVQ